MIIVFNYIVYELEKLVRYTLHTLALSWIKLLIISTPRFPLWLPPVFQWPLQNFPTDKDHNCILWSASKYLPRNIIWDSGMAGRGCLFFAAVLLCVFPEADANAGSEGRKQLCSFTCGEDQRKLFSRFWACVWICRWILINYCSYHFIKRCMVFK